jgi:hypothetical protein
VHRLMAAIAACLVLCVPASALAAYGYCSKPSQPGCLIYGDPDEFCRSSVKRFLDELAEWADCVAKQARDEANEEAEAAVKKWNCRADGNSYC